MAKNEQQKEPMSTGKKILIGCGCLSIVIVIAVISVGALGIAGLSKVTEEVEKQQEKTEEKEKDSFESPHDLGEKVRVGEIDWTLTNAKDLGGKLKSKYGDYGEDCISESGTFIRIKVKVKNNTNDLVTITDLELLDSQKRSYTSSSDTYSCTDDELFILDNINPGIEKSYVLIYEVPKDASQLRIKVGDLKLFGDDTEYISLGF